MKRIGFILLSMVSFLLSCQEDWKEVPEGNLPEGRARLWMIKTLDGVSTKAVGVKEKLWDKGDTIHIKFLTGGNYSVDLENKVKQYAALWLEHANLHFEYVPENEDADVKIGFDMDERWLTWSTIGKDCQDIPQTEPSLNFYGLGDYADDAGIRGDVLRGFGHVLGFVFEHQRPESPIQFSAQARKLLTGNYGLSPQDVDQLMYFYNTDQTNFSEYDPNSIMVLPLYPTMLVDKSYATNDFNTQLSPQDIELVKNSYKQDQPAENVDSLAVINIKAINEHIAAQEEGYQLFLGVNYDGGEKLPFTAYGFGEDTKWVGYVSYGVIHRLPYPFEGRVSFIFENELYYIIRRTPSSSEEFVIYSLPDLEEKFHYSGFSGGNQFLKVMYTFNGNKYITGGNMIKNKVMTFEVYNLTEQQKETYSVEFPLENAEWSSADFVFVKDGFIYMVVGTSSLTNVYKIQAGTFDNLILIGSLNSLTNAYDISTSVNGKFYLSCAWRKMLIIDSNDQVEWKDLLSDSYLMGYGNKLYIMNEVYSNRSSYYKEYIFE